MSGSPWAIPAVGAAEAAGGSIALWRQAQAQMEQLSAPGTASGPQSTDARHEDVAPSQPVPQTTGIAQAQPATPHRLSSLQLDPTHLARSLRPGEEQRASPCDDDEAVARRDEHAGSQAAAIDPEHWLASLARRWSRSDATSARQALRIAQSQWSKGRRVLLACGAMQSGRGAAPATTTDASSSPSVGRDTRSADGIDGWAALLMGRIARADGAVGLTLDGPRWPIRLAWRDGLPADHWCSARAVKQAAGLAWQMTPVLDAGAARAEVALIIGPAIETERRWERTGIRLPHGAAFRAALGTQWSLTLIATRSGWITG